MAVTCYLAERTDPTVRLFDFADPTGVNNLGTVKTRLVGIDAGSYQPELGLFAPDTGDGSFRTKRRAPSVDMVIQLRTTATSQDNHRKAMNRLFSLMEVPRVIVYQGEGMAEAVHIFTLGMTVEQLLRGGQDNWDLIVRQFEDVGMDLVITRQPIILLATELDSAVNGLANATMIVDQDGADGAQTGRPDGWSWRTTAGVLDATPISAEATGGNFDGYTFGITGAATTRDLTQDDPASAGQTWAAQFTVGGSLANLSYNAVVFFLNGAAIIGTTVGTTVTPGAMFVGQEVLVSVGGAVAPVGTTNVRIGLRVTSATGPLKTTIFRRAQLEQASNPSRFRVGDAVVSNNPATTGGRNSYFWNDGEASVPVKTLMKVNAGGAPAVQMAMVGKRSQMGVTGLRALGDLQATRYVQTEVSQRGWTVTYGTDTTNPGGGVDADASGATNANFIRTTHATSPATSQRRFRATRTTILTSLRGRYKVFGRFRPPTTPRQFGVQLKWSPSTVDPAINVEPEQVVDTYSRTGDGASPTITQGWVEVELGSIELPLDQTVQLGGIALEVWTRVILPDPPTAATLDFDLLWLVPADAAGNEDAIGQTFISGSSSAREIGKTLTSPPFRVNPPDPIWVAGQVQGNVRRLRGALQAAGLGPNAGIVYGAGRHRVTFFVNDLLKNARSVKVRVSNVTGNAEVHANTYTGKVPSTVVLEWTGAGGVGYQPMIGLMTYGSGTPGNAGYLDILSIVYEYIPSAVAGETFRSDPGDRYIAERLDSSLNLLSVLDASGELPFFADRGLNFMSFRMDDVPLSYYLDRQNRIVRDFTVSFVYRPGFYEL